ncbi:hypothetical protein [Variovorax sp. IB41]|uniref:hypothetical protein n=1 Tax=Variovorax sp. IB41 TaxID=2779370 RepID=UPI0018E7B58F|nr:hypothetical protein [Variovorax sp. IB41]MBJ2155246.1 hypothetical protein [Variovorax sp. IB41]
METNVHPLTAARTAAVEPEVPFSELSRRAAKNDWINRYVAEWQLLANGRVDAEYAMLDGSTLHYVVGHRLPEEIARQHFNGCTGADSNLERAEEKYQSLAVEVDLVSAGTPLSKAQLDFAYGVAVLCASVGDRFRDPREGSAGDQIRASYGPVPF